MEIFETSWKHSRSADDIDLVAIVGSREVTNPFMVTEVYTKDNGKWKLDQLTFSHLVRPVKVQRN